MIVACPAAALMRATALPLGAYMTSAGLTYSPAAALMTATALPLGAQMKSAGLIHSNIPVHCATLHDRHRPAPARTTSTTWRLPSTDCNAGPS